MKTLKNTLNKLVNLLLLFCKAMKYYWFFRRSHNMTSEELERYQFDSVKRTLLYASKKVPYYRDLFRTINFDPERDFKKLEDIKKIPYTDKETLRNNYQRFLSEDIEKLHVEYAYTSGSTGTPLKIALDVNSRAAKYAMVYKLRKCGGYSLWDKAFSLWGVYATIKKNPFGIDKIKNILYYANNKMTINNNIEVGKLLRKFKPIQFEGYARSFLELGKTLVKENIERWSPNSIFCYGDCLTDAMRDELTNIYQTKVYDFYSHVENVVVIGEFTPSERYVMEDFFYPEIKSIKETIGGGELVGTSFYNFAMPLIRYRTGDIIEIENENLDNQISFLKIKSIKGREHDYIVLSDGRKILSIQRAIYGYDGIIASQVIQTSYTDLCINMIVDEKFNHNRLSTIATKVDDVCGTKMHVTFNIVNQLEKSQSGKAPFIIRRL